MDTTGHGETILNYTSPATSQREWPFWFFVSGVAFSLVLFTLPFVW